MAMPWSSGLSPHSAWIVFSAPEITTVSKPKRNPASAEVRDQKKMRAFISKMVSADSMMGDPTSSAPLEAHPTINALCALRKYAMTNRWPGEAGGSADELEPSRLTVYKGLRRILPGRSDADTVGDR